MDRSTKIFLWLVADALGACDVGDEETSEELKEIVRRLKTLAGDIADDLSCDRLAKARTVHRK